MKKKSQVKKGKTKNIKIKENSSLILETILNAYQSKNKSKELKKENSTSEEQKEKESDQKIEKKQDQELNATKNLNINLENQSQDLNNQLLNKPYISSSTQSSTPITPQSDPLKVKKQCTLEIFGIKIPKANNLSLFPPLEPNKTIKIASWNINGIRAILNKGSFQEFLEKENPDILCLNETKIDLKSLQDGKIEYLFNKKYLTYWNCSKIKKGYSGVAIFTKYKPIEIEYGMKIAKHDNEGRVMYISFDNLIIVSVYTPNCGMNRFEYRTKEWDLDFLNFIEGLKKKGKPIIITGDMNVCHKENDIYDAESFGDVPPFSRELRENFTILLNNGFVDSYRKINGYKNEFSWFGSNYEKEKNVGMRIDYILVSNNVVDNIKNSVIMKKYEGSDHVPVYMEYEYK